MKPQDPKKDQALEQQFAAARHEEAKAAALNAVLARFDALPDEAYVRLPVVMALFACSAASVWRYAKTQRIPAPQRLGSRITAWKVGQLRAALKSIS